MYEKDHIAWDWLSGHNYQNSEKGEWYLLFGHLFQFGERAKPTKKWLKSLQPILEEVGEAKFQQLLPGLQTMFLKNEDWFVGKMAVMLRGLLWAATLNPTESTFQFYREIIEKAFKRVSGKGAFAQKIGQSGLHALASLQHPEAMVTLLQMKSRTKYSRFIQAIDKAIAKIAEDSPYSEADLLDQLTPDYGLDSREISVSFGDYTAQIYFSYYNQYHWEWLKPDGKIQKSIPAIVKKEAPEALAALKKRVQDIKQTLQAQRHRLENAWRTQRSWEFSSWKKHILQHPLLSILSEGLIWEFHTTQGVALCTANEGVLNDVSGQLITPAPEDTVKLWHPVKASVEDVLAWRDYLFHHQIKQPFKQAFREVYVLTSAEESTYDHSNRFSAHILKQNILWALSQQRGWKIQRKEKFGTYGVWLNVPACNYSISLDLALPSMEFYSTQRLRFLDTHSGDTLPLEQVDTIIFSEVMRDVDLFIALSSIGNDPNWDGSPDYDQYWMEYSYGDLSDGVSAQQRKQLLEKIIPNTKIASKCSFEGNFLVVKGTIHTYKINIGSSNVLMLPQNEYLCIVPDRRAKQDSAQVFLPFDGDSLLSLILSKAFLLVHDDTIDDPAILSQLHKH